MTTQKETSDGNGPLIRELARLIRRPVASSLSSTVYRRLPQDTDFTLFRKAGMPGYNFAFIDGLSAYHSKLDTPDNLSRASVQHHGDQAVALARGFAGVNHHAISALGDVQLVGNLGRDVEQVPHQRNVEF